MPWRTREFIDVMVMFIESCVFPRAWFPQKRYCYQCFNCLNTTVLEHDFRPPICFLIPMDQLDLFLSMRPISVCKESEEKTTEDIMSYFIYRLFLQVGVSAFCILEMNIE